MNKILPLVISSGKWFNYSHYLNWTYEKIQSLEDYLKYFNPNYTILNESMSVIYTNTLTKKDEEAVIENPHWDCVITKENNTSKTVACYFPSTLYFRQGYVNTEPESYICYFAPPNALDPTLAKTTLTFTEEEWNQKINNNEVVYFPPSRVVFSNKWRHKGVQYSANTEGFNPNNYIIIAKPGAAVYSIQGGTNKISFKYEKNALETVGTIIPFVFELLPTRFLISNDIYQHDTWGSGAQSWILDAAEWSSASDIHPNLKIANKGNQLWTGSYPLMHELKLTHQPKSTKTESTNTELTETENINIEVYEDFITDEVFYSTKVNISNHSTARYGIVTTNSPQEVGELWMNVHVIVC